MNCKERYLVIVKDVNECTTELSHTISDSYRDGFIEACRIAFGNTYAGGIIMAGDEMYFDTEHKDRPMCGGVWLDWKPTKE